MIKAVINNQIFGVRVEKMPKKNPIRCAGIKGIWLVVRMRGGACSIEIVY